MDFQPTVPGANSGSVVLTDNSLNVVNATQSIPVSGTARASVTGLAAGTHVRSAVYSGDKNNPAGVSAKTNIVVNPVPVNLGVACWNSSFAYGANYECTVSASSNAVRRRA